MKFVRKGFLKSLKNRQTDIKSFLSWMHRSEVASQTFLNVDHGPKSKDISRINNAQIWVRAVVGSEDYISNSY